VELHTERRTPEGGHRLTASAGDESIAVLDVTPVTDGTTVVTVSTTDGVGRAEARDLVGAISSLGTGAPTYVDVSDALVRDAARAVGYVGGLRAPLVAPTPGAPAVRVSGTDVTDRVVGEVARLLPYASVRLRARRRLLDIEATVAGRPRGTGAMRVQAPERTDLMAEPLAEALDTALGIKWRFGRVARGIGVACFGGEGFGSGRRVGYAWSSTRYVFLTPHYVLADELERARRARAERNGGVLRRVSADVPRPFTDVDATTAHEMWHQLDGAIGASGGRYTELNRALGVELGVATFEHALRGGEPSAPPEWKAAHARIEHEVSAYATTSQREATAEMFKLWWCSNGNPSPLVARFGALVDRFLPPDPQ
jgi:hypothetical protein